MKCSLYNLSSLEFLYGPTMLQFQGTCNTVFWNQMNFDEIQHPNTRQHNRLRQWLCMQHVLFRLLTRSAPSQYSFFVWTATTKEQKDHIHNAYQFSIQTDKLKKKYILVNKNIDYMKAAEVKHITAKVGYEAANDSMCVKVIRGRTAGSGENEGRMFREFSQNKTSILELPHNCPSAAQYITVSER